MKVAAISYLSQARRPCYPFATVMRSVASLVHEYWVCTATDDDTALARDTAFVLDCYGFDPIVPGVLPLVENPQDIGRMLRIAFDTVRERSNADLFLLVQADTAAVAPALDKLLYGAIRSRADLHKTYAQIGCVDARLFHHAQHGWGYTLIGRDVPASFVGDGDAPSAAHLMIAAPDTCCVHLGFLGVEALISHYGLNARVWADPGLAEQYAFALRDREAFIADILLRHSRAWRAPLSVLEAARSPLFEPFIDELGLREEQARIRTIAQSIDPGWP